MVALYNIWTIVFDASVKVKLKVCNNTAYSLQDLALKRVRWNYHCICYGKIHNKMSRTMSRFCNTTVIKMTTARDNAIVLLWFWKYRICIPLINSLVGASF